MAGSSGQARVYMEQGATRQVVASGGSILFEAGGHLDASAGRVTLPGQLGKGLIDLGPYIWAARALASAENFASGTSGDPLWGGMLDRETTPAMAMVSTGDQSFYLNWASAIVVGIKLPSISIPPDLATAAGLSIDLLGESIGTGTASDAKSAFDVRAWAGIGDTEMGATHADFTSTPSYKTVAIASGDLTTDVLNLTLVPEAHAGRAIRLYGGRITYTRKTS